MIHDVAFFEAQGIPSAALLSDAFLPQATYQAESLGAAGVRRVGVAHPISDQTAAQLRAKADACLPSVLRALTDATYEQPPEPGRDGGRGGGRDGGGDAAECGS